PNDDDRKYVFWMFRPVGAEPTLSDEFLIRGTSWTYQGKDYLEFEEFPVRHYKLDPDNPFLLYEFYADFNPMIVTIYRKGIEKDIYKDDKVFQNQFFAEYERQYNGEKYYLYSFWISKADGEHMPTKHLFKGFSEEVGLDFISHFGYSDMNEWNHNVYNP
ncbi:MAG: hypothetical protein AB2421_20520, partial [Thermotaleaceae bacterium]